MNINFNCRKIICLSILLCGLLYTLPAVAQSRQVIRVETKDNLLLLGVDEQGALSQLSYGAVLPTTELLAVKGQGSYQAYPAFGKDVAATALKITHANGDMTTELVFDQVKQTRIDSNVNLTVIKLRDKVYPLSVNLYYKTYYAENIIEQWTEIVNREPGDIVIGNAASACLSFNEGRYEITHFNGDWSNEFNMYETELNPGIFTIDSKEGVRTAQKNSPSFLLSLNQKLDEDRGVVIGGTLAWPGNWQIQFDVDHAHKLTVIPGINTLTADYILSPGKVFRTPSFIYTYTTQGAGDVTRRFHRWVRRYNMHNGNRPRDVVLNNWETTGFDFNEAKLSDLFSQAGKMGFDLFLLDDGWFGNNYPRNSDDAGLGDWEVNHQKLPGGIGGLITKAKAGNLKFGLWVEPEMVNPKSDLYKKHPDWALAPPNRPLDLQRNQLILDLANPLVQDHIVDWLTRLVKDNPGLTYLKWDCNRYLTNAWSAYLGKRRQANLYIDYAAGFLGVLQRFRAACPNVTMMLCASGGGRMDYGSLAYFDEYWPSDNSNAHDRVTIQWGMNYFFPSVGFAGHVSEMGTKTPIKFRFDVAMAGKLGMDMQPAHLDEQERQFAIKAIATYKRVKDIVFYGDLYRLSSPYISNRPALMYVSPDQQKALVFIYLLKKPTGGDFTRIVLKGLDPAANYHLTELNKGGYSRVADYDNKTFSGKYLMEVGLNFSMWNVDESAMLELTESPVQ